MVHIMAVQLAMQEVPVKETLRGTDKEVDGCSAHLSTGFSRFISFQYIGLLILLIVFKTRIFF